MFHRYVPFRDIHGVKCLGCYALKIIQALSKHVYLEDFDDWQAESREQHVTNGEDVLSSRKVGLGFKEAGTATLEDSFLRGG